MQSRLVLKTRSSQSINTGVEFTVGHRGFTTEEFPQLESGLNVQIFNQNVNIMTETQTNAFQSARFIDFLSYVEAHLGFH